MAKGIKGRAKVNRKANVAGVQPSKKVSAKLRTDSQRAINRAIKGKK